MAILSFLYKSKIIAYEIDGDEQARSKMMARSDGRRTVPQIFINDKGIGGCDELHNLEKENKLDLLVK